MTRDDRTTEDDGRRARRAALARDLDALHLGLAGDPPLPPEEVRRRIDAIADEVLALDALDRREVS